MSEVDFHLESHPARVKFLKLRLIINSAALDPLRVITRSCLPEHSSTLLIRFSRNPQCERLCGYTLPLEMLRVHSWCSF